MKPLSFACAVCLGLTLPASADERAAGQPPVIDVWYGDEQPFGNLGGHPQRWINILGSVQPAGPVESLSYRLNGGAAQSLSFREDKKRIARDGDFNVEILRSDLADGENIVLLAAKSSFGEATRAVKVLYDADARRWPLPYSIDWSKVQQIQDAAQVVDGKWQLTSKGVRSIERYYDRVLAFGDATWQDYEVKTTVTIHALTPPKEGGNSTDVTHAAIALRWPGHDPDGRQPTGKWHPLGATGEFRLGADLQHCRWRVFDGQREFHRESSRRRVIDFEREYAMKHRVETLADAVSRYRVKLWPVDEQEPAAWDFERLEPNDDVSTGSALLLAHHSDVTFGNVTVVPIDSGKTPAE